MKNEEARQRAKEERNVLRTTKEKHKWPDWSHLSWNCTIQHIIEGKIKCTGRRGSKHKHLPNGLKAAFPTLGSAEKWCSRYE